MLNYTHLKQTWLSCLDWIVVFKVASDVLGATVMLVALCLVITLALLDEFAVSLAEIKQSLVITKSNKKSQ